LRADGAGNSGGAGTDGGKNHKNKRKARNHDATVLCHSS
jgi:ribosomal protein L15